MIGLFHNFIGVYFGLNLFICVFIEYLIYLLNFEALGLHIVHSLLTQCLLFSSGVCLNVCLSKDRISKLQTGLNKLYFWTEYASLWWLKLIKGVHVLVLLHVKAVIGRLIMSFYCEIFVDVLSFLLTANSSFFHKVQRVLKFVVIVPSMKWAMRCISAKKRWPWAILSGLISQVKSVLCFSGNKWKVSLSLRTLCRFVNLTGKHVLKGSSGVRMSGFSWKDMTVWFLYDYFRYQHHGDVIIHRQMRNAPGNYRKDLQNSSYFCTY